VHKDWPQWDAISGDRVETRSRQTSIAAVKPVEDRALLFPRDNKGRVPGCSRFRGADETPTMLIVVLRLDQRFLGNRATLRRREHRPPSSLEIYSQ
jgi:hypothetical protein